jgi:hypothetical protein
LNSKSWYQYALARLPMPLHILLDELLAAWQIFSMYLCRVALCTSKLYHVPVRRNFACLIELAGAFPFEPAGVIQFMTAVTSDRRKSMKHGTIAHGAAKHAMEMSGPSKKVVIHECTVPSDRRRG